MNAGMLLTMIPGTLIRFHGLPGAAVDPSAVSGAKAQLDILLVRGPEFSSYLRVQRCQTGRYPRLETQFRNTAMPVSPDFSGWNCVAATAPRSTAATNGSPCSVYVTESAVPRSAPSSSHAA